MKKRIDFDGEYARFAAGKMREMGPVKDEEMENVLNETMRQWLETPAEWLDGRTPDQYFAEKTPEELVEQLTDYTQASMNMPEPLYGRIAETPACAPALKAAAVGANAAGRATALRLLCDMNAPGLTEVCIDAISGRDDAAEIAVDFLKKGNYATAQAVLKRYDEFPEEDRMALMDVLCSYPGAPGVAERLTERLYNDPEHRGYYAMQAEKLGDEALIEPLLRLSQLSDLGYYDYKEIVNSIEALGGDPGPERQFYGDPDYEALRTADNMPNFDDPA